MELLVMLAIGAATLGLIWLIVREPTAEKMYHYDAPVPPRPVEVARPVEVSPLMQKLMEAEDAQTARVNAGIPRAYPTPAKSASKAVDKPKEKAYSSSSSKSSGGSSYSSRDRDDSWTSTSSYSSYDSGSSSSSSSCDSSSSSSSSSSCD